MSGSISQHFYIGNKIALFAFVAMLAIFSWANVAVPLKTGRYIAALPIVEVRVLDVKPQCEMFRNVGKGKRQIVAVIDCDTRSAWNKSNKFERLGKLYSYRSRIEDYTWVEFQANGQSMNAKLPQRFVSRATVNRGDLVTVRFNPSEQIPFDRFNRSILLREFSLIEYAGSIVVVLVLASLAMGAIFAEFHFAPLGSKKRVAG